MKRMTPRSIAFDEEAELALRHIQAWLLINTGTTVSASKVVRDLILDFHKDIIEGGPISDSLTQESGGN